MLIEKVGCCGFAGEGLRREQVFFVQNANQIGVVGKANFFAEKYQPAPSDMQNSGVQFGLGAARSAQRVKIDSHILDAHDLSLLRLQRLAKAQF